MLGKVFLVLSWLPGSEVSAGEFPMRHKSARVKDAVDNLSYPKISLIISLSNRLKKDRLDGLQALLSPPGPLGLGSFSFHGFSTELYIKPRASRTPALDLFRLAISCVFASCVVLPFSPLLSTRSCHPPCPLTQHRHP